MDKDLLLQNMFQAVESTKAMRDNMDKSFDRFAKKNLAKQRRFTICCKAKDLNTVLEKQVSKEIFFNILKD